MPLFAPPNCRCFEAAVSEIRFIGRRFNSTRVRDGPSVSERATSRSHGLKVSMLGSAPPPVSSLWGHLDAERSYRFVQQARHALAS
jgi:hypothetical protein